MQNFLITVLICTSLAVAACAAPPIPGVHKIDIQQGNVITQEMVDKLKLGMGKSQVRFALGTPTIVDVFHQERWDYVYSLQQGRAERQQRHITVFFEDDKLARIEGDIVPSAGPREQQAPKETVVTVPSSEQKKGFFSGLKSAIGLGKEDDFAPAPSSAKDLPASSGSEDVKAEETPPSNSDTPSGAQPATP